jgi:hypothetical protein
MSELNSLRTQKAPSLRARPAGVAGLCVWGLAVAGGCLFSFHFENTPAAIDAAREVWPQESACRLSPDRPTLVMFVHPRCPCSRASLDELATLMTHCQERVDAEVVFFLPPSASAEWAQTDLWESAARIPGVAVRLDRGGAEQRRFAASVSGEVFVYGTSGRLAFHGGITAGRGHAGDNPGRSALESLLVDDQLSARTTPVFGCALEARRGLAPQGAGQCARTK